MFGETYKIDFMLLPYYCLVINESVSSILKFSMLENTAWNAIHQHVSWYSLF